MSDEGTGSACSDLAALGKYQMRRVARIELVDAMTARTTVEVPEAAGWECTVYAIVFGDRIERIGSSKGLLGRRCKQTDYYLTKFLRGNSPPQNQRELPIWRECFERHAIGIIHAKIGPMVTTEFGTYNDYLAIENILLSRHKPRLNNSLFR
jgi:hypothetical protein